MTMNIKLGSDCGVKHVDGGDDYDDILMMREFCG
jgi:hypothetical protein